MLRIEPIELSRNELKSLLLAAVLLPPVCTLAGVLAIVPADWPAAEHALAPDAGSVVRLADSVPRLELAPPVGSVSASFTLTPAVEIPLEASLAIETAAVPVEASALPAEQQVASAPVPQASENAESPPVESVSASGTFVVQAGVFSKEGNARRCREGLLRRGVSSAVLEHSGARETTFHVVLGRYESWREAQRARKQLAADLHIELIATRLPMRSVSEQVAAI